MATKSYREAGFSQFLVREFPEATGTQKGSLSEDDFSTLIEGVSGNKITSGLIRSKDGTLKLNLDKPLLELIEGIDSVIMIGKFDDGTRGIKIKNTRGNEVILKMLELVMGTDTVVPGANNTGRLFVDRNAQNGKNRLRVQFVSGAPVTLASQI